MKQIIGNDFYGNFYTFCVLLLFRFKIYGNINEDRQDKTEHFLILICFCIFALIINVTDLYQ